MMLIMKWGYFFGDEFNGDQINEDLWHPNYPLEGFRFDGYLCCKRNAEPSNGFVKLKIDTTSEWRKISEMDVG